MSQPKRQASGSVYLRPPGRDIWYYQMRLADGSHLKRRIGKAWKGTGRPPEGFFTASTAREFFEAELDRYINIAPGSNPTFAVAAQDYIAYLRRTRELRESTLRRYEQIIRQDLVPEFGELRLTEISKRAVIDLREKIASRPAQLRPISPKRAVILSLKAQGLTEREIGERVGLTINGVEHHIRAAKKAQNEPTSGTVSTSTLNQTRTLLVGIFGAARRLRSYTGPDPSGEFERAPVREPAHIDVYTPSEVLALARAASSDQDAAIYLVGALAGLRRSELRSLRWRDIDFTKSSIFVRGGYTDEGGHGLTKSGRSRSVPMVPQVARALEKLSRREHFTAPTDLVFCATLGGELDGAAMYKDFIAAAQRAGLRRLRFHDLRHTFCTVAVRVWPLTDVKAYAGHASIQTTLRYIHHKPHTDAAERLGAFVDAEAGLTELPVIEEVKTDVED